MAEKKFDLEKLTRELEEARKDMIELLGKCINNADKILIKMSNRGRDYESYPLAVFGLGKELFMIEAKAIAGKQRLEMVAEQLKNAPRQPCEACREPSTTPIV